MPGGVAGAQLTAVPYADQEEMIPVADREFSAHLEELQRGK